MSYLQASVSEEAELLALAAQTPPLADGWNAQKLAMQKTAAKVGASAVRTPKRARDAPKSATPKGKRSKASSTAQAPTEDARLTPTCYV